MSVSQNQNSLAGHSERGAGGQVPCKKVVGVKQSRRAIRDGRALRVYIACDADPSITEPVADICRERNIPVNQEKNMAQLGRSCGISVGASVAALVRDDPVQEKPV